MLDVESSLPEFFSVFLHMPMNIFKDATTEIIQ